MKILLYFLLLIQTIYAQNEKLCLPVVVDGFTHEWPDWKSAVNNDNRVSTLTDAPGDGKDIDIVGLQVTNDDKNLYFRLILQKPYPLGENNTLFLELDTDNDPHTGYFINGIGAELGWQFGQRWGYYKDSEVADFVRHLGLGFLYVPPFTSSEYEVTISLEAEPRPGKKLFSSDTVKILLWDRTEGGDMAPDKGKTFTYVIQRDCRNSLKLPAITPKPEDGFRLLSWNVFNDGITDSIRQYDFNRVIRLLNPDIINLIECWKSTADEVKQTLSELLPGTWHVVKYGEGVILASRFKIEEIIPVRPGANENIAGFRLRIGKRDIMFFSCHLSCCYFDQERIMETQALMAIINKVATFNDGNLKMPVILAGDFNIVGSDIPYRNLTTGSLHLSQKPVLRDLVPIQVDHPVAITWRDPQKLFSPARLDYIFYSPVNLHPVHSFILNTSMLDVDTLSALGLDGNIMKRCSDHLPLVADFKIVDSKSK
ncbi:MAG: endonuclease/exonuclease/phosphatase family protein [Bacteroidales bacterium]